MRDCTIIITSDSQLAMFNGFKEVFCIAELILCTKHLRDNIERQLSMISNDSSAAKRSVKDIFHRKDWKRKSSKRGLRAEEKSGRR